MPDARQRLILFAKALAKAQLKRFLGDETVQALAEVAVDTWAEEITRWLDNEEVRKQLAAALEKADQCLAKRTEDDAIRQFALELPTRGLPSLQVELDPLDEEGLETAVRDAMMRDWKGLTESQIAEASEAYMACLREALLGIEKTALLVIGRSVLRTERKVDELRSRWEAWMAGEFTPQQPIQLHKRYLQRLLEQDWTTVSMSLFAPQDPSLAKRIKLSDIYTPLPVRFKLTLKFDMKGRLVDWWSGGEPTTEQDDEVRAMAALAREAMHGERGKPRDWPEMGLDGDDLHSLVEIAERALKKKDRAGETITWQPDACHAALVRRRFVLVGDPGSGKSTFLRHLALSWAGELLKRMGDGRRSGVSNLPGQPEAYTPIYIELRSLPFPDLPANQNQVADMPGVSFFREYLKSHFSDETIDFLFELLRDEDAKAAILLDGLDEIPQADDARRRGQVHALVNALAAEFPDAPIIIAARPYAYRQSEWQLEGFGRTELAPLPRDRQVQLAEHLFTQISRRRAEVETRAFANALQTVPEDLASNPLLLTLLAAIWVRRKEGERELPRKRGELYRRGLMLLLEDWVRQKRRDFSIEKNLRLSAEDLRLVLQLVAAYAQEKRQSVDEDPVITEGDIFEALRAIGRGDVADDLVDHLEGLAGILKELAEKTPGAMISPFTKRFRFVHQSFQEYLAACEYLYRSKQDRPRACYELGLLFI